LVGTREARAFAGFNEHPIVNFMINLKGHEQKAHVDTVYNMQYGNK
jgi:hypothetical protein